MMRVVWVAAVAAGALFAGSQTSRAQYGGPYPPAYVPPAYTQRQVIPNIRPTVNPQAWNGQYPGPYAAVGGGYPPEMYTGYANELDAVTGWYVSGMVGAVYLEDQHSDAIDPALRREEDVSFDWNANGGAAIGYRFPSRPQDLGQLRVEFDTIYSENKVKSLLFNSRERDAEGEVSSQSFMFNIVLDFIHWGDLVTPYVGGGAGLVRVNEHLQYGTVRFFDTDLVFGFQGMAGISVKLWENVDWFTEYRYLGGSNPKFTRLGPPTPVRVKLRSEYNSHSVLTGIRIDLR